MTTVKIDAKDRDVIAKICTQQGIEHYFMENQKGDLLTVVIYSDSPAILFYLGRSVQIAVEMKELKRA